ncbi:hypothetical protein T09_7650 [Trichinella sp. T9]|nr:hypothetical protein T09_7650 [Trichinella sp. T9]
MEKLIVKFFVYAICYTSDQKLNNKTALSIAELLIDSKVSRFPIDTICLRSDHCNDMMLLSNIDRCNVNLIVSRRASLRLVLNVEEEDKV